MSFTCWYAGGMDYTAVTEHLISSGTAFAGLVLVFFGVTLSAYDGYDTESKRSVRGKYQKRGIEAFAGFGLSVLAVMFGFLSEWFCRAPMVYIGLLLLAGAVVVTVLAAISALRDLFK